MVHNPVTKHQEDGIFIDAFVVLANVRLLVLRNKELLNLLVVLFDVDTELAFFKRMQFTRENDCG